ncbi:MAG: hypothetical protein V3R60_03415, partial [Acidobacteriota bacterium]
IKFTTPLRGGLQSGVYLSRTYGAPLPRGDDHAHEETAGVMLSSDILFFQIVADKSSGSLR